MLKLIKLIKKIKLFRLKFVIVYFLLSLLYGCKIKNDIWLKGEYIINNYNYKDECISCNGKNPYLYFTEKGWLLIQEKFEPNPKKMNAQFKINVINNYTYKLKIYNCNINKFNGSYIVKKILLNENSYSIDYKIVFKSGNIYMDSFESYSKNEVLKKMLK